MSKLEVLHLSKRYPGQVKPAVHDLSFSVEEGDILALVGPSGCGKTTCLRLIAGLERPDFGWIHLNGKRMAGEGTFIPPEKRGVGLVFQEHALFPHMNVYENVAFGLKAKNGKKGQQVNEYLELVGLQALAKRYPQALSGGERQRVALARALAPQPELLLLDEPFSSLDADLRIQMREQVRKILKSIQATVIFVTHDQEEALFMGDRLAVFQDGEIEQIGSPEEVFHQARSRFVAEFMGSSDFIGGLQQAEGVHTALGVLQQARGQGAEGQVQVAMRADDIDFTLQDPGNGCIAERFFHGAFYVYRLRLDSGEIVHANKPHTEKLPVGRRVQAVISAGHPLPVFREE